MLPATPHSFDTLPRVSPHGATRSETSAADSAPPIVVELRGVRRHFDSGEQCVRAVDGIDLTIRRGEVVALLGPNGAGKTTTLDMLLGLSAPSEGSVRVQGMSPARAARGGAIAAVLQTGGLLGDLTVGETLHLIASLHGARALARIPSALAQADLTSLVRRRIARCSGGEQQRVKFALALVADPGILVLDEPTAGMDVTTRRRFWDVMRADADAGRTIVFATHYLEEAEQFARRTVVMHRGRIVADAPTAQLRAGLGARRVAATLPECGADGIVSALHGRADVTDLRVDAGRVRLSTPDSDAVAAALLAADCRDLEIAAPTLETAFATLTGD